LVIEQGDVLQVEKPSQSLRPDWSGKCGMDGSGTIEARKKGEAADLP
jgi:hypothetical protein